MKYIMLSFLLLTSMAQAQVKPYFQVNFGRSNGNQFEYEGFTGKGSVGLQLHQIGAELSIAHQFNITRNDVLREGNITLIPIMFNLFACPPISKHWSILAKGGVGYVMADRELSNAVVKIESYPHYRVDEKIKGGVGYQFGGGLVYRVTNNIDVSFEVMELFFESTIKHTRVNLNSLRDITYVEEGAIDLGTIAGTLGIKFK